MKGFMLIELGVVICIIAILGAILVPQLTRLERWLKSQWRNQKRR